MMEKTASFWKEMVLLKGSEWRGAHAASSEKIYNSLLGWFEPAYVVNLRPSAQDSRKLKVWALHFFKFENVGQNYDVL